MPRNTICKTVHQYNKELISEEDMRKLLEIAADYSKVKEYVYQRYSGPSSLPKLYPGYTIQNEMTNSGLRKELGLPSVYFYLAVFEALSDIKGQWTRVREIIQKRIGQNENFTPEEKHYLRFLMKAGGAFESVLNRKEIILSGDMQKQREKLEQEVEIKKLQNYLRRQARKHQEKLHTKGAEGFSAGERAYRYGNHGIYLSIKEKRKRIFVPLTDNNQYQSQLYIQLYPKERKLKIHVPVYVAVRSHPDYRNQVGLAMGMQDMLTTDQGHKYGVQFGEYHMEYADWIRKQAGSYYRNKENNPGRKKYNRTKNRYEEQLHSYINQELNRFLQTEKPETLYLPKLPGSKPSGVSKSINHSVTLWQRGYIRSRLKQKCRQQSIKIVEVMGKDISNVCSRCGEPGKKRDGRFICLSCGFQAEERTNAACNAKKRGQENGGS